MGIDGFDGKVSDVSVERIKDVAVDLYLQDLGQLIKGVVPNNYTCHRDLLKEALPYFDTDQSEKYRQILNVGRKLKPYITAGNKIKGAEEDIAGYKKTIEDFLDGQ
jgi:hypothetical protein